MLSEDIPDNHHLVRAKHGSLIIVTRARVTCQGCRGETRGHWSTPATGKLFSLQKQATPSKYISLGVETCLVLTKEGGRLGMKTTIKIAPSKDLTR